MGAVMKGPRMPRQKPAGKNDAVRRRKAANDKDGARAERKTAKAVKKTRARQSASGATRKTTRSSEAPKRNFNWLNRILVLLAAGVVTIALVQAYIALQAIPVERITVTGELEHTRTAAVQDMVYPALGGGFLWADLSAVREQLEALPWIHEATVRRVWPNALEIHVIEQLPIARWGDGAFLNHEGEVFRPASRDEWRDLPLLRGPEGSAESLMRTYQRLVDLLKPLGLGVTQLDIDVRGQVAATLGGGQRLVIGGSDFLERVQRFKQVYRSELAARMGQVESIDLRYERGVAVDFAEVAESPDDVTQKNKA